MDLLGRVKLKPLLLVLFNGGLVAAAAAIGAYDAPHFDILDPAILRHVLGVFLSGALYGVMLYLQNPQGKWDGQDRRDAQQ